MGLDSIWHWLILLVIVLAVFGTTKLRKMGPDLGNAVREFKKALGGEDKGDSAHAKESLKADPPEEATADAKQQQTQHESTGTK